MKNLFQIVSLYYHRIIDSLRFKMKFQILTPILFFSILLIFNEKISAQIALPANDSYLSVDSLGQANIFIELQDSVNVSEIEVVIGSQESTGDVFSNIFVYDQITGLANGLSYLRSGTKINLGIGTLDSMPVYYTKVRIKNAGNYWSIWLEYVSN